MQLKVDTGKIVQSESIRPSGHLVPNWRRVNVDATSSSRIDVNTTSFYAMCSLGLFIHNIGEMDGHQLLSE